MEILLDFVYTETVLVTVENVQELLPAACLLQLKGKHSQNGCLTSCDRNFAHHTYLLVLIHVRTRWLWTVKAMLRRTYHCFSCLTACTKCRNIHQFYSNINKHWGKHQHYRRDIKKDFFFSFHMTLQYRVVLICPVIHCLFFHYLLLHYFYWSGYLCIDFWKRKYAKWILACLTWWLNFENAPNRGVKILK